MKITANRKSLIAAVKQVVIASQQESNSLLSQTVMISAYKTKLKIAAASSVVWMKTHLIGKDIYECQETGECGVSHKFLLKVLSASLSDDVSLAINKDNIMEIRDEGGVTSLGILSLDNFPEEPKTPKAELISFPADEMIQALRCVSVAAEDAKDNYRKALSGVLIDKNDDGDYVFVATDSYRLAVFPIPGSLENEEYQTGKILTSEMVKILMSLSDADIIQLAVTDNHCYAVAGESVVRSVWEADDYPKYKSIIEKVTEADDATVMRISNAESFKSALSRVTAMAMSAEDTVSLSSGTDTSVSLAWSSDYGEAEYSVSCEYASKSGDDSVSFNRSFLKDAVVHAGTENEFSIQWYSNKNPVLFTDTSRDGHFHIVMPKIR